MSLRVDAKLRALAHPIRLRILSLLTGAPMTAADVARQLDLTHANASYHLRQLLGAGTIRVVDEQRIRGGMAKRYGYDVGQDEDPSRRPGGAHLPQRRAVYGALASELCRRAKYFRYAPARQHLTDAELWVHPDTWAEVRARTEAASDLLHRAAKPPHMPGAIRVSATIALFEMEPDA